MTGISNETAFRQAIKGLATREAQQQYRILSDYLQTSRETAT